MVKKIIALILALGCVYYMSTSSEWKMIFAEAKAFIVTVTESEMFATIKESLAESLGELADATTQTE